MALRTAARRPGAGGLMGETDVPTGLTKNAADRFHAKVDRRDDTNCWPWSGAHFSTGYPAFWLNGNNVGGHRVALLLDSGPGEGMALHSCDNPGCVNPRHLRWGTPAENMRDRSERQRAPLGELHSRARLTASAVRSIRARHAAGEGLSNLGLEYGVTRQAIYRVVNGHAWRHVA